jgi:death on curing protein
MKIKTSYLTVEKVIDINKKVTEETGGCHGILKRNELESAVNLPKQVVFDKELFPSIEDKASSYLHSISRNHPFQDGNKRTALVSCDVFLGMNNRDMHLSNEEKVDLTISVAEGKVNQTDLATIIKRNTKTRNNF